VSEIVWLPDSDTVLSDIADVCPLIWDAVQAGTVDAMRFFGRKRVNPYEPSFYPVYVRYRVKAYLDKMGVERLGMTVRDEEEADVGLRALPNLGLQLKYKDYEIRLRKSDGATNRLVPPAGPSLKTQGYYKQEGQEHLYLPFDRRELQRALGGANLLGLWIPRPDLGLANIMLALPKKGGTTRASVETHWIVQLPKPLVAAAPATEHEDLSIKPRQVASDDVASNEE
jgi:hypothetical protein